MWRHDVDELPRCDNLGSLPELWEMSLVAGHQIVRASRVGTFQEFVIARVICGLQRSANSDRMRTVPDKLKEVWCWSPLRMRSSGRASSARYSAKIASEMYSVAGGLSAISKTVRWSPSGFRAAETRMLVSSTSRSGIIYLPASMCSGLTFSPLLRPLLCAQRQVERN